MQIYMEHEGKRYQQVSELEEGKCTGCAFCGQYCTDCTVGGCGRGNIWQLAGLTSLETELLEALDDLLIQTRQYGHKREIEQADAVIKKAKEIGDGAK